MRLKSLSTSFPVVLALLVKFKPGLGELVIAHTNAVLDFGCAKAGGMVIVEAAVTILGFFLGPSGVLHTSPPGVPNGAIFGPTGSGLPGMDSLCDPTITSTIFARADDGRGSTKERPGGMDLVIWIEVDCHFALAQSPISIHRVQQNVVVFCSEFRDVSPLTASKSLKDEE